ncbi:heavy metal translocating P-type ATPase [Ferruginibacter yonginensis]|uniref:Heavy metal translocating P-type ATPase n=1 Tax=Ferruginibacter yonginensis TaxID=1310416 RepID=A0ABV8QR72_9BACT
MQTTEWKVEGMTCSNCALSITNYLKKEGLNNVAVNAITGEVSFADALDIEKIKKGIQQLGYKVVDENAVTITPSKTNFLHNNKQRFLFTLPVTVVLMLHMLPLHMHWLMNPWVQAIICLPVFVVGMYYFGKSAYKSLLHGSPNMNVLITVGAIASFGYSMVGAILNLGEHYLFFETTASIITLVFFGNYLEEAAIQSTQKAVKSLTATQKVMANMIAFDDQHQEQIFPIENKYLKNGDLVLIKNGEQVPADCKILWGDCSVNEAIITGEFEPITKQKKDTLIGGSTVVNGLVKAIVTAAGKDTVLANIIHLVQQAQAEKPPLQKLADRISAVFVPVVLGFALLTFIINYFLFDVSSAQAMLRGIAVLVISCPCAMGLATPAAIAVGLGRAAKLGILFKNASALETFKKIKQVVFDKTGTLTTGKFTVTEYQSDVDDITFKKMVYSLEKFSNHPIAKAITEQWKTNDFITWQKIEEIKGVGMVATDHEGNIYKVGSHKILPSIPTSEHNLYVIKNDILIGWINLADEIRPEAASVINWLHQQQIKTILLSGDSTIKCAQVAQILGIDEVYASKTPSEKLAIITSLNAAAPTAMVGDGINDAPALAKASLGISLSDAAQIAIQSADVILMNQGLKNLPMALGLGKHTYRTIKQNLFWAFIYNIVALPIAAFGLLTPTLAALAMGFSDIVLAINSVKLYVKKVTD